MTKRILALLLSIVLVLGLLPSTVLAADIATYTVVADKTTAKPGDTINFSVNINLVGPMTAFEATVVIPAGLTLVPGSQTVIDKTDIGFDDASFESNLKFQGFSSEPYTTTGTLTLVTFQCTVDADAEPGAYIVTLENNLFADGDWAPQDSDVVPVEIAVAQNAPEAPSFDKTTYTVVADKTTAKPGDTINFSVNINLVGPMTAFEATVVIPAGLTLVPGSQTVIDKTDIGFDDASFESNLKFQGFSSEPYTTTDTLTLVTFQCTVDADAEPGAYIVTLENNLFADGDWAPQDSDVVPVEITVEQDAPEAPSFDKTTYTVVADKTTAKPGDTINFSANIYLTGPMTAFEATVVIPAGLTLVPGSQTVVDKTDIGFDDASFESNLKFQGFSSEPYTTTGTLTLVTFQCTVDANAAGGKYTVTLENNLFADGDWAPQDSDVVPVEITIEADACAHGKVTTVKENEKAADCLNKGSYESVTYCALCGVEISRETISVNALGHTAGEPVVENENDATCSAPGSYDNVVYCSVCEAEMSRETVPVNALPHTAGEPVVENKKDPDCLNKGSYDNVVYCSVCKAEMSRETISVDALGHTASTPVTENNIPASCTTDGSYETVVYCSVCAAEIKRDTVVVKALGHTAGEPVVENENDATCGAPGSYDNVVYCSVCEVELSRETVPVNALPHTAGEPVVENKKDPDCLNKGSYDKVVYCSVCKAEMSRETISVNALGHTAGEPVVENKKDPDCLNKGSYDKVVYCSVCEAEMSRETISVDALGHTAGTEVKENEVPATLNSKGSYDAVVYCTVCKTEMSRVPVVVDELTGAVAEINGFKYATLQAAFNAAQDNDVIEILCNITITAETAGYSDGTYIDGVRYVGDKSFTVDFNGFTVTDDGSVNDYMIYVNNKGEKANEITFMNGTVTVKDQAWSAIAVNASTATQKCVLNLNGMTVNMGNPDDANNDIIRARKDATVNLNAGTVINSKGTSYGATALTDGVLNINSGAKIVHTDSRTSGGNLVYTAVSGNGTINVYAGAEIVSDNYGIHNMTTGNAVVNIYGGTITAPVAAKASTNGGADQTANIYIFGGTINGALEEYTTAANVIVSGGTFNNDVTEFLAENVHLNENEGIYTACAGTYKADVTKPTCTTEGYTTYTCSDCNDSYVTDKVAALGHNWIPATTEAPKTCDRCGATEGSPLYEAPAVEVIDGVVTIVDPDNAFARVGVFYVGDAIFAKPTTSDWDALVAAGKVYASVNGKDGYKVYTDVNALPTLTTDGNYVFFVKYNDHDTVKTAWYTASVEDVEVEIPSISIVDGNVILTDKDNTVNRIGVFYIGDAVVADNNWDALCVAGRKYASVNTTAGYQVYSAETLPASYSMNGNYVFFIKYYDAADVLRTVWYTASVAGVEPVATVEDGKITVTNADKVARIGIFYIGTNEIPALANPDWNALVTMGKAYTAINGNDGYKVYTDMNALPELTIGGNYVMYMKYTANGKTMTKYFSATVEATEAAAPVMGTNEVGLILNTNGSIVDKVAIAYVGTENKNVSDWGGLVAAGKKFADINSTSGVKQYNVVWGDDLSNGRGWGQPTSGWYAVMIRYTINGETFTIYQNIELNRAVTNVPAFTASADGIVLNTNGNLIEKVAIAYIGTEDQNVTTWGEFKAAAVGTIEQYNTVWGDSFADGKVFAANESGYYAVYVRTDDNGVKTEMYVIVEI